VHTVYNELSRPGDDILAAYRELLKEYSPSCLAADARLRAGAIGGLRSCRPEHRVVGPAFTVRLDLDDLVDCMPVLRYPQAGDIVVLAAHGAESTAMWGALMTTISQKLGVAAAVVDGAVRDIDEIYDADFPLWFRTTVPRASPTQVHERTEPVQVNVPVVVGGEVIEPGDIIVADINGLTVVPQALAGEVLEAARRQVRKEMTVRAKIRAGASAADLLAEYGHL
jgi:4-hydroxy-4-methyl-2-oxoglutarate aldolase